MRKLLGVITILLVLGLTGCLFGGPGKVTLHVDDESIAEYKIPVQETLKLPIPSKEGMMFTGWKYGEEIYFDEFVVPGNAKLYAQWEDPNEVFSFNTKPLIEYEGLWIGSYTGTSLHVVIPAKVNDEFIMGIEHEAFEDSTVETMFLPMDAELNGFPFTGSNLKRLEFYGEFQVPVRSFMTNEEYDDIMVEYSVECVITEGSEESGTWTFAEGCPIVEVSGKTEIVIVAGVEYFTYELLLDVNFYSAVQRFWHSAFTGATKLETVRIPTNILINFNIFESCVNLKNIIVEEDDQKYTVIDGVLYSKDETELLIYPAGLEQTEFTIPESVDFISQTAFITTTYLETLIIPSGYTENAFFFGANSLKEIIVEEGNEEHNSIDGVLFSNGRLVKYPASKEGVSYTVPSGTTGIGGNAFSYNKYLEEINLSNEITYLGNTSFGYAESLETIDIPRSVEWIGTSPFLRSSITTIIIRRDSTVDEGITMLQHDLFTYLETEYTIYVPETSLSDYLNDERWSRYSENIQSIDDME